MNPEHFEELIQAIRRAKAVRRGDAAPSRVWELVRGKDNRLLRRQLDPEQYRRAAKTDWENVVTDTRAKLHLSQNRFAELLGISVKTLHNWEQGRRKPTGAARVLLKIAARHPQAILEVA